MGSDNEEVSTVLGEHKTNLRPPPIEGWIHWRELDVSPPPIGDPEKQPIGAQREFGRFDEGSPHSDIPREKLKDVDRVPSPSSSDSSTCRRVVMGSDNEEVSTVLGEHKTNLRPPPIEGWIHWRELDVSPPPIGDPEKQPIGAQREFGRFDEGSPHSDIPREKLKDVDWVPSPSSSDSSTCRRVVMGSDNEEVTSHYCVRSVSCSEP